MNILKKVMNTAYERDHDHAVYRKIMNNKMDAVIQY